MSEVVRTFDEQYNRHVDTVRLADDRNIAVLQRGDPNGVPVIALHGNPGSRLGPWPRYITLYHMGINFIAFDRPGYGASSPNSGRSIADTTSDVEAIADAYKLDRFCVVARSGGVPHALGCAALMPDRVANLALMVGVAPPTATFDWRAGMSEDNARKHTQATQDPSALRTSFREIAAQTRESSAALLKLLAGDLLDGDKIQLVDSGIRRQLCQSYVEGLRQDGIGWLDDVLAMHRPWGFECSSVVAPTLVWHGEHDPFAAPAHSRWIAQQVPNATMILHPNASHFNAIGILPDVLAWQAAHYDARPETV